MIRVLHVIDSFDLGGAQTVILNLVQAMDRSEFHLEVAGMHGEGPFKARLEATGISVHSLSPSKWPPRYFWNFSRLLKRGKFDVVHFHLFGANWIAKPITALQSRAVRIVHDHCNDAVRYNHVAALLLDSATNRLSDHIFCVSESTRDFLLNYERLDDEKVSLLANAVDTEEFRPASMEERHSARRALGISETAFVIGGVGRLVPQKDFGLFLQIAGGLPEAEFVIAGVGPMEAELRQRAGSNVRFLGFQEDRTALYAALDVLLLTSVYEGMPMTVLEAMAAGVAVVSTRVDGVAEAFGSGQEALIIQSREPAAFVRALKKLAAPAERLRLAELARRRIELDFAISRSAKILQKVYRLHLGIA